MPMPVTGHQYTAQLQNIVIDDAYNRDDQAGDIEEGEMLARNENSKKNGEDLLADARYRESDTRGGAHKEELAHY